jgi:hypothetical protein
MGIIYAIFQDHKFNKLNKITCSLSHLLRCINGLIYEIKPLMRLVHKAPDFKDWAM